MRGTDSGRDRVREGEKGRWEGKEDMKGRTTSAGFPSINVNNQHAGL